jgi:N-formylglutamate amidohydrolase
MWKHLPAVALLAALVPAARADGPDLDKFVWVQKGTLPVILSAPHGGRLPLPGVPDRKGAGVEKFVVVLDTGTLELTEKAAAAIERELGGKPYVVAARFPRKQCDANRPAEGAYESQGAKPVYDRYHAALKAACDEVRTHWGRGLLLDIHGQAAKADTIFRGTRKLTTCEALVTRFGPAAVHGPKSVLGVMAVRGLAVFPPLTGPADAKENPSFGGGHIVATYGSGTGTNVDAIQLEIGGKARAKTAQDKTAADLAAAVKTFAAEYLPAEKLQGK